MSSVGSIFIWMFKLILLYALFIVCFIAGALTVGGAIQPGAQSEPGLVSETGGLLIIALANILVIVSLIESSRWGGWRLSISLALAYYGAVTLVTQIETWYFLSSITVGPQLLPRLFLMGIPTSFVFIPLAVFILGKRHTATVPLPQITSAMHARQRIRKLAALVIVYLLLYFGAGYFIAWQNPALRAFYGHPEMPSPFFAHMGSLLRADPMLLLLQAFRALIWVACALPVIHGSRLNPWWSALLVGVFFSVPQNIAHSIANPLMPIASVRMSHMIETASSTFIFGLLVVWILHREHHSFGDLVGIHRAYKNDQNAGQRT